MIVVESAWRIGCESNQMPLSKRVVERPRDVVGKTLGAQLLTQRMIQDFHCANLQPLPDLIGALDDRAQRALQELRCRLDVIADGLYFGVAHAAAPNDPGAEPLRMVGAKVQACPGHRHAGNLQPAAQLDKDLVDNRFVVGFPHQPIRHLHD